MRALAAEGRTVLVSSHLMAETASFVDHLVVVAQGALLADLSMKDFIDSRSTPRARLRTSAPDRLRAVLAREGVEPVLSEDGGWTVDGIRAEQIGSLAAREGIPLLELVDERASLEQAYLELTATRAQFSTSPA